MRRPTIRMWVGMLLCMFLLMPMAVNGAAARVTLFYSERLNPQSGSLYTMLCAEAVKEGYLLECKPAPADGYNKENQAFVADVTKAAAQGAVLMAAGPNLPTIDLTPYIQRESRYKSYLGIGNSSPLNQMGNSHLGLQAELEVFVYNRQILREIGVSMPSAEQTWDDFAQFMQTLMAKSSATMETNVRNSGIGVMPNMVEFVARVSGTSFSTKTTQGLYDDGFRWTLKVLHALHAAGLPVTNGSTGVSQAWDAFKAGKIPVVRAKLSQVQELPTTFDWAVTPFPSGPNGQRYSSVSSFVTLGIAQGSKDPQAGWDVLLWLVAGNGAKILAQAYPLSVTAPLILDGPTLSKNMTNRGIESVLGLANLQRYRGWPLETWQAFNNISPVLSRYVKGELGLDAALGEMENLVTNPPQPKTSSSIATMPPTVSYALPPRSGVVKLRLHTFLFSGLGNWLPQAIRNRFPNIDIEVVDTKRWYPSTFPTETKEAVASSDVDLVIMSGNLFYPALFSQMVNSKLLLPLDPFISQRRFSLAPYGNLIDQMRVGGRLYDIPLSVSPDLIFCNTSIFASTGINLPTRNWTWDDFLSTALSLTREINGQSVKGFIHPIPGSLWYTLVYQLGYNPMTANRAVLDAAAVMVTNWQESGILLRDLSPYRGFIEGKAGFTWQGPQAAIYYSKEGGYSINLLPLPATDKANPRTTVSIASIGISAKSKHQQEAWQVVEFLTSDAVVAELSKSGRFPAKLSTDNINTWATVNWPEPATRSLGLDVFNNLSLTIVPSRQFGEDEEELRTAMQQQMDAVLAGTTSRQEAIATIERLRQELLSK